MIKNNKITKNNSSKVSIWGVKNTEKESEDFVIKEAPFTIQVDQVGSFTLLCTPTDLKELAFGFIFTEGLISSKEDIIHILEKDEGERIISLQVREPNRVKTDRNLIVTSSCGICGKHNTEQLIFSISSLKNNFKFNLKHIELLEKNINEMQELFHATGGAHAAAIFDAEGNIVSFFEDVGRHNAFDKAIGSCLINEISTSGLGVFLSSRISFEMVVKAARARIELIIGVSAPTDLAIKAAKYWNITLCGFVRHGKGNIYTAKERIF